MCNRGLLGNTFDVRGVCPILATLQYLACRAVWLLYIDLARAGPTGSIASGRASVVTHTGCRGNTYYTGRYTIHHNETHSSHYINKTECGDTTIHSRCTSSPWHPTGSLPVRLKKSSLHTAHTRLASLSTLALHTHWPDTVSQLPTPPTVPSVLQSQAAMPQEYKHAPRNSVCEPNVYTTCLHKQTSEGLRAI